MANISVRTVNYIYEVDTVMIMLDGDDLLKHCLGWKTNLAKRLKNCVKCKLPLFCTHNGDCFDLQYQPKFDYIQSQYE